MFSRDKQHSLHSIFRDSFILPKTRGDLHPLHRPRVKFIDFFNKRPPSLIGRCRGAPRPGRGGTGRGRIASKSRGPGPFDMTERGVFCV